MDGVDCAECRVFGDPATFALICRHEPIPNESGHVFGRMCIQAGDIVLGDYAEPACMLNVAAFHLERTLVLLPELRSDVFDGRDDLSVWNRIDTAIYDLDGDYSVAEVAADAERFFKFDFLTGGGASFDNSRSFITCDDGVVRILFMQNDAALKSIRVQASVFTEVLRNFLAWIDIGGK